MSDTASGNDSLSNTRATSVFSNASDSSGVKPFRELTTAALAARPQQTHIERLAATMAELALTAIRAECDGLTRERDELRVQRDEFRVQRDELRFQRDELRIKLTQANNTVNNANEAKHQLQLQVDQKIEEIKRLREDFDAERTHHKQLEVAWAQLGGARASGIDK